ncbi:MAG: alpha-glucan family phosphorylase [Phycisphaeraceae bacterium]
MLNPNLAKIRTFDVVPALPDALKPLEEIAHNLWWSWHPEAVELFVRLDRDLWQVTNHNPVRLLGECSQERLDEAAKDEGFMSTMQRVSDNLHRHMQRTPWLTRKKESPGDFTIAYFCAEFGLTECLQIYSGGLGCLAGDHLKSAAELGLPLVAVGLLYRHGYFQQYLNADGWQQEYYPDLDFANLPVRPVKDSKGQQVKVIVPMPGRDLHIAVWRVDVGRIALYLLDTNIAQNDPLDRGITGQLYGGDMEMRIKQEIVLGIGGLRALEALGVNPDVCHMNEGHSAFLALERIRKLIEKHKITFDEARQSAAAGNVFTTHTPVPAGIDRFPPDMVQRYFKSYHDSLGLDMEGLLALGRENVFNKNEFFSMAVLAIRTSDWYNGVSKLHGHVSRAMWQNIWPGVPADEVPITHITNGVHARSWLSADAIYMLDRYLGGRWQADPVDQTVWSAINEVPDEELWRIHERRRGRLVIWTRRRLRKQLEKRGANVEQIEAAAETLDPDCLTIGFARRFATYKRANLLLRDPKRLLAMLANSQMPIQFVVAGKAHPADGGGKDLIRQIVHFAQQAGVNHRIVFVENYDIHVARYMVQGCDVWLNTPRRGMEASGTSGMKAAINGVLNLSILDGWWDEAAQSEIGWSIGRGETYANLDAQDDIESQALYDLLEKQIIPLFYNRDEHGVPRQWIGRMKKCIATLAPAFNTNRMVQDYAEQLYLPALRRLQMLTKDNLAGGVALAHQKDRLRNAWGGLRVEEVRANTSRSLGVRDPVKVSLVAHLGDLKPQELRVQLYVGKVDNDGRIMEGKALEMTHEAALKDGKHRYTATIDTHASGKHGFAVRIVPGGEAMTGIYEPGMIFWDNNSAQPAEVAPVPEPEPVAAGAAS